MDASEIQELSERQVIDEMLVERTYIGFMAFWLISGLSVLFGLSFRQPFDPAILAAWVLGVAVVSYYLAVFVPQYKRLRTKLDTLVSSD